MLWLLCYTLGAWVTYRVLRVQNADEPENRTWCVLHAVLWPHVLIMWLAGWE